MSLICFNGSGFVATLNSARSRKSVVSPQACSACGALQPQRQVPDAAGVRHMMPCRKRDGLERTNGEIFVGRGADHMKYIKGRDVPAVDAARGQV